MLRPTRKTRQSLNFLNIRGAAPRSKWALSGARTGEIRMLRPA
jgi:hypothetical protein